MKDIILHLRPRRHCHGGRPWPAGSGLRRSPGRLEVESKGQNSLNPYRPVQPGTLRAPSKGSIGFVLRGL